MESKNSSTVYYLITENEIYRTDEILSQIDKWHQAFRTGRIVRLPNATREALDEFETHLEQTYLEGRRLSHQEGGGSSSEF